ncbi:hypothetical protein ONA91_27535 [Micromonospora sp. DR5-3]|uniref:hypothetical protein n=1 Tax=unclassified Micromonospora TaxID=2617518 RepID=UPI0011DC4758|nr:MULTISPECIES: hypothetical protein [unclassified Micromonospora]MCW3818209.1 hypothetical protein [Micromonospora sp. DR5-3]TYC21660.1 hypothetical protein FXF52_24685 [Micromonospora sp. MP36]
MEGPTGVVFPLTDGTRSTSALGRAVVADALRAVDPVGARSAEHETNWRHGYLVHFRRLVEAGLLSRDAAVTIARDGLTALHARMRVVADGGAELPLDEVFTTAAGQPPLDTATVTGSGEPERELSLPYRGQRLRGDELHRRLDAWVTAGVIEPSCAEAVRAVMANPDWLDLRDQRVVVLGAGAEMGPLPSVLRWGGDVVAVDLPRPDIWRRLLHTAHRYGGRLHLPVRPGTGDDDQALAAGAGADLLHRLPQAAQWLLGVDGRLVLGNYVYADGATNVRVAMAVDALTRHLQQRRDDVALAFLATPTDVYAVPAEAVAHAERGYAARGLARRSLRVLSGGRLLHRNYPPDADPGVNDSLVPQQGPNYALAKRLQRWRAAVVRDAGTTVSFTVAPPTRTRSVLRNRALAAAYAGAHRFGIEVFDPATSNTLMAALLVHDLRTGGGPAQDHPWRDEAYGAAHGGLWRVPYAPRSALGLAVLLGLGAARG